MVIGSDRVPENFIETRITVKAQPGGGRLPAGPRQGNALADRGSLLLVVEVVAQGKADALDLVIGVQAITCLRIVGSAHGGGGA